MPLKAICRPPLVGSLNYMRRIERTSTNRLVQRLFFTNQITINHIEVEGAGPAIVQAYATGCCDMREIAHAFDIHYATVSGVLKKGTQEV